MGPQAKGQKRKVGAMNAQPEEPKQRLNICAQMLAEETLQKGDIVYETTEDGGKFTATVTLQSYDPSVGYQGLPGNNKKEAEANAAEAAFQALSGPIAAASEIHEAKKRAKKHEALASFKAKQDEKKAAREGLA